AVFTGLVLALTKPLGVYLFHVFEGPKRPLARFFGPLERLLYKLSGVDPEKEQTWKEYTFAVLLFAGVGAVITYAILRLQHVLPLNPQHLPAVSPGLAFNTAI